MLPSLGPVAGKCAAASSSFATVCLGHRSRSTSRSTRRLVIGAHAECFFLADDIVGGGNVCIIPEKERVARKNGVSNRGLELSHEATLWPKGGL